MKTVTDRMKELQDQADATLGGAREWRHFSEEVAKQLTQQAAEWQIACIEEKAAGEVTVDRVRKALKSQHETEIRLLRVARDEQEKDWKALCDKLKAEEATLAAELATMQQAHKQEMDTTAAELQNVYKIHAQQQATIVERDAELVRLASMHRAQANGPPVKLSEAMRKAALIFDLLEGLAKQSLDINPGGG